MNKGNRPRVGEASAVDTPCELFVSDFLQIMDPPRQFDLELFDPTSYYVTSGDAIQKAKYLSTLMWKYAGTARKQLSQMKTKSKASVEFEKMCWKNAGACNKMIHALKRVRGDAVFLETEWNDEHKLLCIPKNPRSVKKIKK